METAFRAALVALKATHRHDAENVGEGAGIAS